MTSSLTRRTFLGGSLAAAAGASLGAPFLTGCSGGDPGAAARADASVQLPRYTPNQPVQPDLAPEPEGVQPGFFGYPAEPARQFDAPPLSGATFELFTVISSGLPTAKGQNTFWQAVQEGVGADIEMNMVPASDYVDKLATTVAGGQYPDILQIFTPPPDLPALLEAEFTDLSPYLSGDAIADYPNLAAIPTQSWQACVFSGGLYAVPIPRALVGPLVLRRDDILAEAGVDGEPQSFADLLEQAEAVTGGDRWAFAQPAHARVLVEQMLGVPNGWREENGTFTCGVTLPEAKEARARVAEMVQAGLLHPEALASGVDTKQWFGTGLVTWLYDNYPAWPDFYRRFASVSPQMDIGGLIPPPYESGVEPTIWQGSGYFAFNALKRADEDRIRELLTAMNWFAAPFGTAEYLLRKFGVQGEHFELEDGVPIPTEASASQRLVPFQYIADAPEVIFQPGLEDAARKQHAFQVEAVPRGVPNAATGLFSPTAGTENARIGQILAAAELEIFAGRQPIDTWDEAVAEWRAEGGDQIKAEYEEQFATT